MLGGIFESSRLWFTANLICVVIGLLAGLSVLIVAFNAFAAGTHFTFLMQERA